MMFTATANRPRQASRAPLCGNGRQHADLQEPTGAVDVFQREAVGQRSADILHHATSRYGDKRPQPGGGLRIKTQEKRCRLQSSSVAKCLGSAVCVD